jgi:uncharacterized protein YjbI with pentapeptide repeats
VAEGFTCAVEKEEYRSACKDLPKHPGSRYCVLHEPGPEKNKEDFLKAKESKLARKDYDFGGTVFPEGTSDFKGREFDADANFAGAIFNGTADFSNARFNSKVTSFIETRFSGERTDFKKAQFSSERADFREAQFKGEETSFSEAQFSGKWTHFSEAQFSGEQTSFLRAKFTGERTDFREAKFTGERTFFNCAKFTGERTDFSVVQFSSSERTYFREAQFSGKQKDFKKAQFTGEETDFREAQFSGEKTDFREAQFSSERTYFREAQFKGEETSFSGAEFGSVQTGFQKATFKGVVHFSEATFKEKVTFWGTKGNLVFDTQAWVWFHDSRIEKPEVLKFHTVLLHPGWFINTDVRKVDFTDVKWYGMPNGRPGTLDEGIQALKDREREIEAPHTLLAQACRRLSTNAEENHEYLLANEFHYWSLDALRIGRWRYLGWLRQFIKKNWRRIRARFGLIATLLWIWRILRREPLRRTMPSRFGLVPTFYWALSGYGVRAARAFWVLIGMWATFTALYVLVDPSEFKDFGQGIGYRWQAAVYSLLALARLNPEPPPDEPGLFQFLVGLEGILGPLQIALLALAVRRKVMR